MKFNLDNFFSVVGTWAKSNLDATLVLAIATETPRWTVVFTALHEPAWIGVTMGVLISWAAKRGWNAWNKQRNRHGLFVLNTWVLLSAVAIMSPVLLEMTKHPIEHVNVSDALLGLHKYAVWLWVLLVAQSTFMPLIQAVVAHDMTTKHAIDDVAQPKQQPTQYTVEPMQNPEITLNNIVHIQNAQIEQVKPSAKPVVDDDKQIVQCEIEQRNSAKSVNPHREEYFVMLRNGSEINKTKLSAQWDVTPNTLRNWEKAFGKLLQKEEVTM